LDLVRELARAAAAAERAGSSLGHPRTIVEGGRPLARRVRRRPRRIADNVIVATNGYTDALITGARADRCCRSTAFQVATDPIDPVASRRRFCPADTPFTTAAGWFCISAAVPTTAS
jgi:glycine/D-amino acid oxidase-like deaminating enzyme